MGSGKWEVGCGKWVVGNGKWEVRIERLDLKSGRWELGSGKWDLITDNGLLKILKRFRRHYPTRAITRTVKGPCFPPISLAPKDAPRRYAQTFGPMLRFWLRCLSVGIPTLAVWRAATSAVSSRGPPVKMSPFCFRQTCFLSDRNTGIQGSSPPVQMACSEPQEGGPKSGILVNPEDLEFRGLRWLARTPGAQLVGGP
jgi:hypothetical protein